VAGGTVFLGMFAHTLAMMRGRPHAEVKPLPVSPAEALLVAVPLASLVVLGLWMPAPLRDALAQAAAVVRPLP
jgi:hypothetical protein